MFSDVEKQVQSLDRPQAGTYDSTSTQNLSQPVELDVPQMPRDDNLISPVVKPWSPVTLRPWFYIPLLILMVAIAIALEVALHFSQRKKGWPVRSGLSSTNGILHYVYTLPPVGVAMIIVALWAWTDLDIRRQQPYIDLAHGNCPASRSLLLDYSGKHPALVAVYALGHNHFIVAVSSALVLLGLALQPMAASLFIVRSVYNSGPDLTTTNLQTPGLVPTFSDFTSFYVAAGFTGSSVLYNVTPPQFVNEDWVVAAMTLPDPNTISNGTLTAVTTGIHSLGHCASPDTINLNTSPNGTSFTLTGTSGECNASVPLTTAGVFPSIQANIVGATCAGNPSTQFGPIAFWTFFQPAAGQTPQTSLVFCRPTVDIMNVEATVQVPSGHLLNVTPLSNFSSNITDPNGPLKGQPLNGAIFNLVGVDPGTITRGQATKTALSTAIVIKAESLPGGLPAQLSNLTMMVNITQTLYERYLSTAAKENYFLPHQAALQATTMTFVSRLYIVPAATHILVVILLLTALVGSFVHYFHARIRDRVVLLREPGTLAAAAAYTARSNIADIMDPYADGKTLNRMLKGKRFRMDKGTGRIVMEGDEGYEDLASPIHATYNIQ